MSTKRNVQWSQIHFSNSNNVATWCRWTLILWFLLNQIFQAWNIKGLRHPVAGLETKRICEHCTSPLLWQNTKYDAIAHRKINVWTNRLFFYLGSVLFSLSNIKYYFSCWWGYWLWSWGFHGELLSAETVPRSNRWGELHQGYQEDRELYI